MKRNLFGVFSGLHLTIIICTALLAPGMLYAAVTYSRIAITDPNTGALASVDQKQRLRVYDNVAGYTKNPAFVVNISDGSSANRGYHTIYTVPNDQVFLLKSVTWSYFASTDTFNSYYYVFDSSGNTITSLEGLHVAGTASTTFDAPIIIRAGTVNAVFGGPSASGSNACLQGYLVPADAVPAPSSTEALQQFVRTGLATDPRRPQ